MYNKTIQVGDTLVYFKSLPYLDELGFKLNKPYRVSKLDQDLVINLQDNRVLLTKNNNLTNLTEHFKLIRCPVILPRGI